MTKHQIVIHVEGGIVQCVYVDNENLADFHIIDHDIEGLEESEINMIEGVECIVSKPSIELNPAFTALFKNAD